MDAFLKFRFETRKGVFDKSRRNVFTPKSPAHAQLDGSEARRGLVPLEYPALPACGLYLQEMVEGVNVMESARACSFHSS